MGGKKPQDAPVVRSNFAALLADVKGRIQSAQTRAVLAVNCELVRLYWEIGRIIDDCQRREGWGAAVIPRLARELKNELPDLKGFSERNLGLMIAFARQYPQPDAFSQPPVARLPGSEPAPQPAAKPAPAEKSQPPVAHLPAAMSWAVPWAHHVIIMQKGKDLPTRRWYMERTFANGCKPIGISTYELTRALPAGLQSVLPLVEEIEAELSGDLKPKSRVRRREA